VSVDGTTMGVHPLAAWDVEVAVLDDDPDFRAYITEVLQNEPGLRVRAYASPQELFAGCQQRTPDLLLLDLKMGPERGEEVLAELRQRYPRVCVIVVTGYPSLENMRETFRLQAFDYLAKPFSLAQLRQAIAGAIQAHGLGRYRIDRLRKVLGERLRHYRLAQNKSLRQLAQESGISLSQISSIERGTHSPSMDSLLALCQALKVKPSELFAAIGL